MPVPGGVSASKFRVFAWIPWETGFVDNDPVDQLTDWSGNGNHLLDGTGQATYKEDIINGLPVLEFDGVDDQYRDSWTSAAERITYFLVFKHLKVWPDAPGDFCMVSGESGGANKVMFGSSHDGASGPFYVIEQSGTGGAAHQFFGTPQKTSFVVHRQRYDSTDRGWEDGVELTNRDLPSSAAGNNASIGCKLGSREDDSRYWNGQLVGFAVCQGLTDQEEEDIETALMVMLLNVAPIESLVGALRTGSLDT